ncbi:unnamed protein product [Blepharisma stoltei]|uniref:non-specific serine/threonine protein kinase n=1 Tax=Blepharisma stoltei TaxID=1481888 RepID=A0AAU9KDL6_9CILI|nr:unnamed protein product [Blepharisma stoltei]
MTNKSTLDDYTILEKIGSGLTAKVKVVRDSESGEVYAAKIYRSKSCEASSRNIIRTADNEIANLQQISHPNVIKLICSNKSGEYVKKSGERYSCAYIVMEFCPNGNFYETIRNIGRFNENISRFYFHQLINAIDAAHQRHIVHRDLKLENLLLDGDYNLKVTDFGFSASVFDKDGSRMLRTHLGTEGYMAPELYMNINYYGESVDVFAAGVILFIFRSVNPPFSRANMSDRIYEILVKNPKKFWGLYSRNKPQNYYSEEFKSLIMGMLHPNPERRFTIYDIKNHPWYNGPIASLEEVQSIFRRNA